MVGRGLQRNRLVSTDIGRLDLGTAASQGDKLMSSREPAQRACQLHRVAGDPADRVIGKASINADPQWRSLDGRGNGSEAVRLVNSLLGATSAPVEAAIVRGVYLEHFAEAAIAEARPDARLQLFRQDVAGNHGGKPSGIAIVDQLIELFLGPRSRTLGAQAIQDE